MLVSIIGLKNRGSCICLQQNRLLLKMAVKRKEMTAEQKEIIITLANDGFSQRKITQTLNIS